MSKEICLSKDGVVAYIEKYGQTVADYMILFNKDYAQKNDWNKLRKVATDCLFEAAAAAKSVAKNPTEWKEFAKLVEEYGKDNKNKFVDVGGNNVGIFMCLGFEEEERPQLQFNSQDGRWAIVLELDKNITKTPSRSTQVINDVARDFKQSVKKHEEEL